MKKVLEYLTIALAVLGTLCIFSLPTCSPKLPNMAFWGPIPDRWDTGPGWLVYGPKWT